MKSKTIHHWSVSIVVGLTLFFPCMLHAKAEVIKKMKGLHMPFIANEGQMDGQVAFYARTFGGTVFVTKEGRIVYSLPKSGEKGQTSEGWVLREELAGGTITGMKGEEKSSTNVSSFTGNDPSAWRGNISTYGLVNLGEVYKGIGLKLKAYGNNVEKLFTVKPGADPKTISLQLTGAKGISINGNGELEARTDYGPITFSKPIAFQDIEGTRIDVPVQYALLDQDNTYGFTVAEYDHDYELVIDPLLQSTYLGGSNSDVARAIAVNTNSGFVYVAGQTYSTNFPGTTGGAQQVASGGFNVFVAKLNPDLTTLFQSTYLGGSGAEEVYSIALDSTGNVYVAGNTTATDFPGTSGGAQATYGGNYDGFVAKLNSNLTAIIQSTYLGGSKDDYLNTMTLDSNGNVYVAGWTISANFPGTTGGVQSTCASCSATVPDAFVTKLNPGLTAIVQSTYLGGIYAEEVHSIVIDSGGNVYVAGKTDDSFFPGTTGGAQSTKPGPTFSGFVAKLNPGLTSLLQSTFLGGSNDSSANSIVFDSSGNVYVAGNTTATDFPGTAGGAQATGGGAAGDGFVAKLNPGLTALLQSTYLGGGGGDNAESITLDSSGNVYVTGYTSFTDFPGTAGSAQSTAGGSGDAFVAKLNPSLTNILQSTYLGGSGYDYAYSIALDTSGNVYVAGSTNSTNFPGMTGGYQSSNNGSGDAFVAKFDSSLKIAAFTINSGAKYTTSSTVTLTLITNRINNITEMQFSNDNSIWSTPESYAATKTWTLSPGDGTKTVYIKFKDSGNWTDAISKTIVLDTTLPIGGDFRISLPRTGQTKCYDDYSDEIPSCSGSGQDGEIQAGVAWPNPRFVDNSDQTITDKLTGLMWTKDTRAPGPSACTPGSDKRWSKALEHVACLNTNNYLGYNDWRLPGMNELESLINLGVADIASWLSTQGFTNLVSGQWYWTSTSSSLSASLVNFGHGQILSSGDKNQYLPFFAVRTVQPLMSGTAEIWKTGQIVSYAAGDDGDLQKGAAWPAPRFTDNGNGTAKDNLTGLIWTKDAKTPGPSVCGPGTAKTWVQSLAYVACLNSNSYLGYNDWRLPNRKELDSLSDYSMFSLPSGHQFSNIQTWYWSSDTYVWTWSFEAAKAWKYQFSGLVSIEDSKSTAFYVLPVRTGAGGSTVNPGINFRTAYTNTTDVRLGLSAKDANGIAEMKISNTDANWDSVTSEPYATGKSWTIPGGDGLKTVYARFKDAAGNWSNTYSATITLDQTPPVATITGTPQSPTNATSAILTVGGTGVVVYRCKLDGGNYGAEAPVATLIDVIYLNVGAALTEGSHTVSVIGKDTAGNWQDVGAPTTAIWTVDLTPPIATITGTPPSPTNSASVTLTVGGTDVVAYKRKVDSGDYSSSEIPVATPITLTSLTQGSHTVSVIGRDAAGNWQDIASAATATWTVDITKPTGTITINNGALGTTSASVTLNFSASDVGSGVSQMCISNTQTCTNWESYAASKAWALPAGAGTKTVYVTFKDAVGNVSNSYSYTITLETTPPVPVIDFPRNGTALISLDQITGTATDADPSSGLLKVEVQVRKDTQQGSMYLQANGSTWGTTPVYHLASLTPGGGGNPSTWIFSVGNVWTSEQSHTVTAVATDNAGNTGDASSTFTYIVPTSAFTTLTMDLSSQTILNKGQLTVTGKLSRLPEVNMDLRSLSISLDITSPTGAKVPVNTAKTGVDGSYIFTFADNNTVFTEKGAYTLQARFAQAGSLAASNSDTKSVLVGASAGYAVLVQGKLPGPNPEGLASHNKTTNRIYKTLRDRGFDDANIMYFNYTMPQDGVDAQPSKGVVESAIKIWASGKMNAVPAPLYIIMVNHGDPNAFHIGDTTISPSELSSWLDALEANLDQEAKREKIITIIGACYSGSFIPVLSKPNTNRIIIASAAADEESFKGPLEGGDSIRSGEYFIDALFLQLGRGYSLKSSFEEATKRTEEYTRKGGAAANTPNPYFDTAMQHPLIDDNGDTRGSNVLAQGQGDGQAAKDVYLGTGATYTTNAGTVDIIGVTETKYLSQDVSDSMATLRLYVNNATKVSSAWAIIRPPALDLSQGQTASSYQRDINLTPQLMTSTGGHYELPYSGFTEPGMYEIFYYIIETGTPAVVSPLKRSVVYKDKAGNTPPTAPTLVKPGVNEDTKTTIIFQWNASVDVNLVTYNLVIATDQNFTTEVYRKDGLTTTLTSVDASAGLKDLTSYYWRVEAVDGYTITHSDWRKFNTNNTNGLPGILAGIVFSDRDYSRIAAATIQVTVNNNSIPVDKAADGSFVLSSLTGMATLSISAPGYQPLTVSDVPVVAGDTTPLNLSMAPEIVKGDINGDGSVTIADAILALRVISGTPLYTLGTIYRDAALTSGKIGIADVISIMQKIGGLRQP